jgi:DNA-binding transcriptional LysR family regulator
VRVGVFPVAAPVLLPQAVARLREHGTLVVLSLREGLEDMLVPAVARGELDCVIGRLTLPLRQRALAYEMLYEEPTAVVSGLRHPLARRWNAQRLHLYSWMLPPDHAPLYMLVAAGLAAIGQVAPRVVVETSSILMIINTLRNTDLLSAIPLGVAREYEAAGQLKVLPVPLSSSLHPVCVLTPTEGRRSPATSLFRRSATGRRWATPVHQPLMGLLSQGSR